MQHFTYPKGKDNKIGRHPERGHYDATTVHSIVNTSPVAHVSVNPSPESPYPVTLPMIVRIAQYENDTEPHAYIHGYISARMFKLPKSPDTPNATEEGVPLSIAATKVDGLVLALTPFNHSYNYRSAIIYGHARLLDPTVSPADAAENLWAMQLVTDGIVPQRWDNCRSPPDAGEIASTRILKVRIDSASAKIRDTGVKDDKKDLKNEENVDKYWTGVIPLWEHLGEPVPAKTNGAKELPGYIKDFVSNWNERVEQEAMVSAVPEGMEIKKKEGGGWLAGWLK
ncbi:hypothetical protein EJ05DRAFT_508579 [Pseudovirgaria hyperparasitica]|uniref:Flavin-nucleotide-binding protein n=1 Tax=Pseudovirgaria hyperparasitica TaxID=470096 RepID=A0A6A6WFA8_9PEZI|nr:uncharacterized protein EJ05DRAFT_508579 [Pseudovirgaria hyperparasitica]KAF2761413.1 hypothetical protein EJ05DRAFT_508579 [Pseudovirgaria hyperparasitica]